MITLKSLDRALKVLSDTNNKNIFDPTKSELAYRLSRMSSQFRGRIIEEQVRDYYLAKGYTVRHFGGSHHFDMRVNGKRIEVKSALARKERNRYTYRFQHIQPQNFDKLVMVFISPEGVKTRVMDSRTVAKKLGYSCYHRGMHISNENIGRLVA